MWYELDDHRLINLNRMSEIFVERFYIVFRVDKELCYNKYMGTPEDAQKEFNLLRAELASNLTIKKVLKAAAG